MFGLSGSWEDVEDSIRQRSTNSLGKFGGRLVSDGILGAAGISAKSRIGLQDMFVKGDPTTGSLKDFMFDTFLGAGGGYADEEFKAPAQIMAGDLRHGIPNIIPIRLLSDIAKATMGASADIPAKGNMPAFKSLDPYETFITAMGGTPTRKANRNEMGQLIHAASLTRSAAIKSAVSGDRSAMNKWNASNPDNRITQGQILKAKLTNKPETARQRANEQRYSAYE